jgi:hypothetical protein
LSAWASAVLAFFKLSLRDRAVIGQIDEGKSMGKVDASGTPVIGQLITRLPRANFDLERYLEYWRG